jgi:molecular chaperone GrpE (heat shock protein)
MTKRYAAWIAALLLMSASAPAPAQDLLPAAVDIVLVVDTSGTMTDLGKTVLRDFVDSLGEFQRLSVIRAGEEGQVLLPLSPVAEADEKKAAREAIDKLNFLDDYADVQAGLGLALGQLASDSSLKIEKIVVLVSDGWIDRPAGWIKRDTFIDRVSEAVLADYFLYRITFFTVAWDGADLDLMQELAYAGAGRCLVAPNDAALADSLSLVADRAESAQATLLASRTAKREAEETRPEAEAAAPTGPVEAALPAAFWAVMAVVIVLGLGLAGLILMTWRRLQPALAAESGASQEDATEREAPSLAQLRYKIDNISKQLRSAGTDLGGLQVDLVSYGAERWERERGFLERYSHLTEHLFLLLDHLELQVKAAPAREGGEALYRKAARILEDEGIEEIAVREGDAFDGKLHKHVGEKPGDAPQGTILEVARKGYVLRNELAGEEEFVLRPAEVIVSSGPPRSDVN